MSAKTDVEALRLIGDEVVRLLSLADESLEAEVGDGLKLIADLARWRDLAYGQTRQPAPVTALPGSTFEVFDCGVDSTKALLYLWQIEDEAGQVLYRYVGKSSRGSARPLTQYRRNIRNHLSGKPYRKGKPDAFREVHLRMADAVSRRHRIILYLLTNVSDVATIFDAERAEQQRYCSIPYCELPPARHAGVNRLA